MRKLQAPSSKLQRNFKLQIPNSRGKTVETVRKDRGGATTPLKRGVNEIAPSFLRALCGAWCLALFILALFPLHLCAQTNRAKITSPSNRYLFIVDTSRSMQPRTEGLLKAVQDLLASGMNGQLRRGDSIGLWTFNQDLHAGKFPLQKWSPEAQKDITLRVATFLKEKKYEKQTSLDKVIPQMARVIKDSEFITVILISDGEEKMRGTPFDDQINAFYSKWRSQQRKAKMPYVTVLRAQRGQITHYSMNSAPWTVEMPPLPPAILAAATPTNNPSPAPLKVQPASVPPLIISGKKSRPEQPAAPKPEATLPKGETPPSSVSAVPANAPTEPVAPLASAPNLASELKTEIAKTPAPKVEQLPAAPKTDIAQATRPRTQSDGAIAESKPAVVPPTHKELATIPPSAHDGSSKRADADVGLVSSPVQTAAVPPEGLLSNKIVWLAGLVLLGTAFGFVFRLRRRSRPPPHLSLITRSLERENK